MILTLGRATGTLFEKLFAAEAVLVDGWLPGDIVDGERSGLEESTIGEAPSTLCSSATVSDEATLSVAGCVFLAEAVDDEFKDLASIGVSGLWITVLLLLRSVEAVMPVSLVAVLSSLSRSRFRSALPCWIWCSLPVVV